MTVSEMHFEFYIGLDKIMSLNAPGFLPKEVDVILNNAQEEFIEQRAYRTNPKRTGLEEDQKRRDDLRKLISNYETSIFTSNINNKPFGKFVVLPSNYRHSMTEEVNIQYTDCNGDLRTKRSSVIPVTHDRYNSIIEDPFNKPYEDEVIRMDYENNVFELITDGKFTILTYYLRYLKEPQRIKYGTQYVPISVDVDCELASHTHREIVNISIQKALENIESVRYGSKKSENLIME